MSSKPDITEALWKSWTVCRLLSPTAEDSGQHGRQEISVVSKINDDDVQEFCRSRNVAAHRVYQIAWAVVLGAYAGTDDVTTGLYMQSRPHEPVVYHCRLDSRESAVVLCGQVKEDILGWVTDPAETVRKLERASRLTGVFDTMLSIGNIPSEGTEEGGSRQYPPLCIEISNKNKTIVVNCLKQILSESQARSMGGCLDKTISQILRHSEKEIRELDIVCASDVERITQWNQTKLHLVESCIHEAIQGQVCRRPKQPAVCAWDDDFTYEELDQRSTSLAKKLRRLGVKKDVIVPFYFHKSVWTVVAILATLKAGGASVGLNPDFPVHRLLEIIRFTGAQIITAGKEVPESIRNAVPRVVVVDHLSTSDTDSCVSSNNLIPSPSPQDIAFVAFTSGSTGTPKGILIDHKSFCSSAIAQIEALDINENSRVLHFSAHNFDAHLLEIVTSLMAGACVCIPSEEQKLNDLNGAINAMGVTWAGMTPTVAQILSADDVSTLKTLVLWGEASGKDIVNAWADKVHLLNVWGPAECSVVSSVHNFSRHSRHPAMVGKAPKANHIWIVRPHNWEMLAPIGSVGEAVIEGFNVARGYLHNPSGTQKVFVRLPWLEGQPRNGSSRSYLSGDLVRYTEKGELQFQGRKDTQVKLRGQRIELEEVEHNINVHSKTDASAIVEIVELGCLSGQTFLAAFQGPLNATSGQLDCHKTPTILPMTGKRRIDFQRLKSRLSQKLPTFMVPDLYIALNYIPALASGKVDRRWLRRLAAGLSKDQVVASMLTSSIQNITSDCVSPLEERIFVLVARILGLDRSQVSGTSSFISLGGNSIRAMQLAAMARREGLVLTVADILQQRHLAALSSTATDGNKSEEHLEYVPFMNIEDGHDGVAPLTQEIVCRELILKPSNIEDIWPATDYQTLHIAAGHMSGGVNSLVFDFQKPPPIAVLEDCCRNLARHHSMLRSFFVVHRRRLLQVVLRNYHPDILLHPYTTSMEEATKAILDNNQTSGCTLGHLITRFTILHEGNLARRLILKISHAQYDGVSSLLLFNDIANLLQDHALNGPPSFGEYVFYAQKKLKESIAYWSNLLAGAEMTNIVRHSKPSYRNVLKTGLNKLVTVGEDLASFGITIASAIKAGWSIVLAEYSCRSDVVFGASTWGRSASHEKSEQFVGACINEIPVRVSFRPGMTVLDLLNLVQHQQIMSAHYETAGCSTIIRDCTYWCPWERFSSVVLYQNLGQDGSSFSIDGRGVNVSEIRPPTDRCDIAVYSEPRGSQTFLNINFCEDIIPIPTAQDILQRLCTVLMSFTIDINARLNFPRNSPAHPPRLPLEIKRCYGSQNATYPNGYDCSSINNRKRGWSKSLCREDINNGHKEKKAKRTDTLDIDKGQDNDTPIPSHQYSINGSPIFDDNVQTQGRAKEMVLCGNLQCGINSQVEKAWKAVLGCGKDEFSKYSLDDTSFYEIWGNVIAACGLAEYFNANLGCQMCSEDIMEYSTPRLQLILLHQECNLCEG